MKQNETIQKKFCSKIPQTRILHHVASSQLTRDKIQIPGRESQNRLQENNKTELKY